MRSSLINFSLAYALTRLREFPSPANPVNSDLNTSTKDGFALVSEPDGPAAQRYREIVDEILHRTWTRKRMVVTSPGPGAGKTITSVNLALSLAEKGFSVFLAELTLMRPRYRYVFGAPASLRGIESVLRGETAPEDATFQLGDTRVAVTSVGVPLLNYALLSARDNLQKVIEYGESACDWTILDVPSVDDSSAVKELASTAGPVVLVARSHQTKRDLFRKAAKTLGDDLDYVILNDVVS